MMHDDSLADSIAVLALGALPEAEAAAVAEHVRTCARCRADYDALRSAANLVGFLAEADASTLDEVTSARMKRNLMQAVRASGSPNAAVAERQIQPAPRAGRSPRPWLAYGALAAAVALGLLSVADDARVRSDNAADVERLAALQDRANSGAAAATAARRASDALERQLAAIVAPGSKHFAIAGGEVVESGGRVLLAFAHLPAPPTGKVYQAWTIARGATGVAPSVTFAPDASGSAVVELPEGAANLGAVAVTVEPPGGSRTPTSKPTFVRKLT